MPIQKIRFYLTFCTKRYLTINTDLLLFNYLNFYVMRKFFATLAVCLCASVMSVSAVENQNTSSELKSTNVSQMTVGADQGQATEYVFATAEGTAFTGDVFVKTLPVGNELCFKATSGEYFIVSFFDGQDFTNVSCSRQAPSGKLKKVKKSKAYFTDANHSVLIVSPNDAGQNRIVKVRLN